MADKVNRVCSVFCEVKNCIFGWPEFRWKSSSQANAIDRAPAMEAPAFLNLIFFDRVTQTLNQKAVALMTIRVVPLAHVAQVDIA